MSTLRTNALEGMDAKNSITIVAGAGNITTTNVQEGIAKVWASFDGSSSGFLDSFNCASVTDHGTGDHEVNYTNVMSNDDYAHPFHCGGTSGQAMIRTGGRGVNTGKIGMVGTNGAQDTGQDVTASGVAVFGDLA
jgi:hypothetical protein